MVEKVTREQISALIDDEVSADRRLRIVDKLLWDPSLAKAWERYNLISDVLRNNLCETALGLTPSARQGIGHTAQDEGRDGVRDQTHQTDVLSSSFVAKRVAERVRREPLMLRQRSPVPLRAALGFALAASIAIVAVLGVQRVAQSPVQGAASPPLPPLQATAPSQAKLAMGSSLGDQERAAKARLASYLVNYSEYLDNGMHGLLPYARIVSRHDANRP